jgi:hypothetical protein
MKPNIWYTDGVLTTPLEAAELDFLTAGIFLEEMLYGS